MRVVTFGEAMVRFSPPSGTSIEKADQFAVEIAGAEANVAVALARLGAEARWVSCLPASGLGRRVAGKIREHGVDVRVVWTDEGRVGLYFVELSIPPRPPQVLYDRAGSAFSRLQPSDIDPVVLDGADIFHVTGITFAVSAGCHDVAMALLHAARDRGVAISFDVNYRSKLSSPESAREVAESIAPLCRYLFTSTADAALILGADGPAGHQAEMLHARFPQATVVVTDGQAGACACDGVVRHQPAIPGVTIDRVGRGDAFCAGYLIGQEKGGLEGGLLSGVAVASLAQTFTGDLAWITPNDVTRAIEGSVGVRYR